MIGLNMDKEQFECIKKFASGEDAQLKAHDFKLSNISEDGLSGHIHTKEIDADFEYREEGHTLILTNEVKHELYGFVSDKTIGSHLYEILGELQCEQSSSTPVQETNSTTITSTDFTPITNNENEANSANQSNPLSSFVKPTQTT